MSFQVRRFVAVVVSLTLGAEVMVARFALQGRTSESWVMRWTSGGAWGLAEVVVVVVVLVSLSSVVDASMLGLHDERLRMYETSVAVVES